MTDLARRRIAAFLLVAGAILALLAITDAGPFDDPPTAEEEARAAVEDFFAAGSEGDGRRFCDLLTDQARDSFRTGIAQLVGENQPPGCEDGFKLVAETLKDSSIEVRYVSVSGNRARVETRFRAADSGARPRSVELLLEDDVWKISSPG